MSGTTRDLRIEPAPGPVTIKHHDAVLGSSERAMIVHGETEGAVYYLPKEDVYLEQMTEGTGTHTTAGGRDARFWSVVASGGGVENAAWQIVSPDSRAQALANYIGFDSALVSVMT